MSYTPVELRHVRVPRRLLGYDRTTVEKLLEEVAESFETVWRDRADLAEKVETLETRLEELTRQERLLTDTLVAAEQTADEVRERAKREAELTLAEARGEARSITREARAEHERLHVEARKIRALLRAALEVVDEEAADGDAEAGPADATAGSPATRLEQVPRPEAEHEPELEPELEPALDPDEALEPAEQGREWPVFRRAAGGGAGFDWGD